MSEQVNALPDKMNMVGMMLIIQLLIFLCKVTEKPVSPKDIIWRDNPLLQYADSLDIFTVVNLVFSGEDMSEKC